MVQHQTEKSGTEAKKYRWPYRQEEWNKTWKATSCVFFSLFFFLVISGPVG